MFMWPYHYSFMKNERTIDKHSFTNTIIPIIWIYYSDIVDIIPIKMYIKCVV